MKRLFPCRAAVAAAAVPLILVLAWALARPPAAAPPGLDELAERAAAAGWRVVAARAGPRHGFYAVPPGDGRADPEELVKLVPGRYDPWGGVVRCAPAARDSDAPPAYAGPGYHVHGTPGGTRAFADAVGIE